MRRSLIEWAHAAAALPGERKSGDREVVKVYPEGVLVAVVDALGHGAVAAAIATLAVEVIRSARQSSLIGLARLCHERLRDTRGAVISMAFFSALDGTLTWMGVGNVDGVLLQRPANAMGREKVDPTFSPRKVSEAPIREQLLLRAGVVGDHLPPLGAAIIPVMRGDLLIFATDGIRSGFADHVNLEDDVQKIADQILTQHMRGDDDALALVARYIKGPDEKQAG